MKYTEEMCNKKSMTNCIQFIFHKLHSKIVCILTNWLIISNHQTNFFKHQKQCLITPRKQYRLLTECKMFVFCVCCFFSLGMRPSFLAQPAFLFFTPLSFIPYWFSQGTQHFLTEKTYAHFSCMMSFSHRNL